MNDHKRKQTKKNKIAALPLVAADFNGELKSSVEEDIKFYGVLPLGELTRDQNLFKPGSPVSDKKIRIIPGWERQADKHYVELVFLRYSQEASQRTCKFCFATRTRQCTSIRHSLCGLRASG